MYKAASKLSDTFEKICWYSFTSRMSFFINVEIFFNTVLEHWSKRIVWNLFISWRLWIILVKAPCELLSPWKCLLRSHRDVANALKDKEKLSKLITNSWRDHQHNFICPHKNIVYMCRSYFEMEKRIWNKKQLHTIHLSKQILKVRNTTASKTTCHT